MVLVKRNSPLNIMLQVYFNDLPEAKQFSLKDLKRSQQFVVFSAAINVQIYEGFYSRCFFFFFL
jgi:hypothetical protein